jgi:hypothetical protein
LTYLEDFDFELKVGLPCQKQSSSSYVFALGISFFYLIAFCLDNIGVAKYMVIHRYTRTKLELSNVKAIETTTQVHVLEKK